MLIVINHGQTGEKRIDLLKNFAFTVSLLWPFLVVAGNLESTESYQIAPAAASAQIDYDRAMSYFKAVLRAIHPPALTNWSETDCHALVKWKDGGNTVLEMRPARYAVDGRTSTAYARLSAEYRAGEGLACISSSWIQEEKSILPTFRFIFGRETLDKQGIRRLSLAMFEKMNRDIEMLPQLVLPSGLSEHFKKTVSIFPHHPQLRDSLRQSLIASVNGGNLRGAEAALLELEKRKLDSSADRTLLGQAIISSSTASANSLLKAFLWTSDRRALIRANEIAQTDMEKAQVEAALVQSIKDRLVVANIILKGTGQVVTADRNLLIARQLESLVSSDAEYDVYLDDAIMKPKFDYKAKGVIRLRVIGTAEGQRNCGLLWMGTCEFKDDKAVRVKEIPIEFTLTRGNGHRDRGAKTVEWASVSGGSGAASGLLMGGACPEFCV